jgi:hypothetical protein
LPARKGLPALNPAFFDEFNLVCPIKWARVS